MSLPGLPMPPTPPARIEALHVASRVAIIGLSATIGLNVVDAVLTPITDASDRPAGDPLLFVHAGVLIVYVVAVIATAAAFITWLFIAIKNLVTWRTGVGWAPGWAIGAWFIPLANLVLPFLVVGAAVRTSEDPYSPPPRVGGTALVGGWWGTLILSGCCSNAAARMQVRGGYPTSSTTLMDLIGTVGYIIAAVLAIILVRRVTRHQEQRQAALDAGWQQALTPPPAF